jgi:flagellar assembly protein FliH
MGAKWMLLKGIVAGAAVGADELGRYLSPAQRALLITRLSGEAEARAAALLNEARAAAAAILAEAEATAESVRTRAYGEGFAAGQSAGYGEGLSALEESADLVRRAAGSASAMRDALLDGVEAQVVELALLAARQVVGAAAEEHTTLAAAIARDGLRATGTRVLRLRVHPDDAETVTAALLAEGHEAPIVADTAIEAGGCIIDTEGGTVDLRLSTRLLRVQQTLRRGA